MFRKIFKTVSSPAPNLTFCELSPFFLLAYCMLFLTCTQKVFQLLSSWSKQVLLSHIVAVFKVSRQYVWDRDLQSSTPRRDLRLAEMGLETTIGVEAGNFLGVRSIFARVYSNLPEKFHSKMIKTLFWKPHKIHVYFGKEKSHSDICRQSVSFIIQ